MNDIESYRTILNTHEKNPWKCKSKKKIASNWFHLQFLACAAHTRHRLNNGMYAIIIWKSSPEGKKIRLCSCELHALTRLFFTTSLLFTFTIAASSNTNKSIHLLVGLWIIDRKHRVRIVKRKENQHSLSEWFMCSNWTVNCLVLLLLYTESYREKWLYGIWDYWQKCYSRIILELTNARFWRISRQISKFFIHLQPVKNYWRFYQ